MKLIFLLVCLLTNFLWAGIKCDDCHKYERRVTWYFEGKTTRGRSGATPQMAVLLIFQDFPHYSVEIYSNELAEHLKKKGKTEGILTIRKKPKFIFFTVEDWDVTELVEWSTGIGCGHPYAACDDRSGRYTPGPSPIGETGDK